MGIIQKQKYIVLYIQIKVLTIIIYNKTVQIQIQMDSESEKAIRLIQVNASGKYILSQEGKSFISKINGPIAVISVAGMYRTGKSYLLNRMLLNRSNGFGVGPTVNPCTKGLWCWGKTITGKTADGQPINVIVIDTQGIGALDQDQTHDTRIFTLAILAASAFIYNSTGSIDENALQNLSLVVNLTKNIQLNTSKEEEDEDDPQELADYFPAFYWVVRDFSLQLINTQGDSITPKQYLQRALAPQKGFSDDVQQKNRIRRLLSSFFKQRECFTLVRPLVDQKKLQHLDQLDMDQLRPEFVDQVMNFRRRILGRVRPKVFKGKQLDGPMYLCLLNSYVTAINNGAVPNIQNAWNYMCQEKCAQAFEYSLSYFYEESDKNVKSILPAQEQYLIDQLKELKEKACDLFEKNSVGQKTKFHLKQLRQSLQHKIQGIRAQNEKLSETMLRSYFKKSIVDIQNKLRLRQFGTFEQFMKELNQFYANLLENGPVLPKKQAVFLSMLKKVIPTAAQIFLKQKTQDLKNFKALTEQKELNLQTSLQHLKKEIKQSEQRNKDRITKLDRQKVQLQLEVEDFKKVTEQLRKQNKVQNQKWQNQLKANMQNYKKREETLSEKVLLLNQQINQLQGQTMSMRCQQEKQTALITLRNKQLQAEIEQMKKKQSQTFESLRNIELNNNENIKNITEHFERKIKQRQTELRQLKNTINDIEEQNKNLENEIKQVRTDGEDQIIKLKLTLNKKEVQLLRITKEKEEYEKDILRNTQSEIDKLKLELTRSSERCIQIQRQLKTQSEGSSNKQRSYETELILLKQKIQFTEVQSREYKNQLVKAKKQFQQKMAAILEQTSMKQNLSVKMQQQAQEYETKISQLKADFELGNKKLNNQIEQLTKQLSESQLEVKNSKNKFQIQNQEQKRTIKTLQEQLQNQEGDVQSKITTLKLEWKLKQKNYTDKIDKLENQLDEIKEQMARQQREEHEKSQQVVLQLKNYYQIEKQKYEAKVIMEKEKYQRKIQELKAEHEQKLRQEISELENQYEYLKEKFSEMDQQYMKEKTNRKIQVDIKTKMIQNLEKSIEQMKGKMEFKDSQLYSKIERLQKQQSCEKETLYAKIEELTAKNNKIQKQKSTINHSKQQFEKMLQVRERNVEELKTQISTLRQKLETDKQSEKTFRNDINTKLMEERVEFEKKMALLSQQNEYLKQKIQENQKFISSHQITHEDKLKKLKEQYSQEIKTHRQKYQAELDGMEAKYEKIKKSSKEKQSAMQKSISQLQKQLAIASQKNNSILDKLKIYEDKQLSQSEQHNTNVASMKAAFKKQKQVLKEQLQNEQKQKQKIEAQKNSLSAYFQQEKLLLENKSKFLEQGKERCRLEAEEAKKGLEAFIENSKKKWNQQRTNLELSQNEHVSKVEKKHWQEKQELLQSMKKLELDYQNKLKSLESQNRVLNERIAIEEQNKMGSQNVSDRKLKQMTQNEKKLQIELDRLKTIRENEQVEIQSQDKERQNLKAKLKEKEEKYRQLQKQKQHLFYQIEKQRAKWKMQKQNIIGKTDEQKQLIQRFERQVQKLQRQNQKLKVERKCQKTSMQSMSKFSTNFLDRGMNSRSSLEESVLKQNINNTSQISDTSLFFKD